jgi:membrane protein implicated in regulation of membrane protease activity
VSWESFYLVCFVIGFCLSVLALVGGAFHLPVGHDAHGWHFGSHAGDFGHGGSGHASGRGAGISPFNFATLMAFLAWFGGMGYLLTGRGHLGELVVLGFSLLAGIAGSAVVFVFLTKVLLKHEQFLESADFEMTGVLGRLTVGIREGGTGEIVYSQAGTRRSAGARSESGSSIARGSEVVVTKYEKGIAFVRPWEELAGEPRSEDAPERADRL